MNNQRVILIHGLLRSHLSMAHLGAYLNRYGYDVSLYGYPSAKYHIKDHSLHFKSYLEDIVSLYPQQSLNIVTHSLGGIIARDALVNLPEELLTTMSSLIMLAPPNQGSRIARVISNVLPVAAKYIKPLPELSSHKDSYVHHIGVPLHMKIGIIAGRFDRKVPPSKAHLAGEHDFIIVNAAHSHIMNHPVARESIIKFIEQGKF